MWVAAWESLQASAGRGLETGLTAAWKSARNAKKILNRGNKAKSLLKAKELAFSGPQNELVFERKKAQSKRRKGPKTGELLRSFVVRRLTDSSG
jgi:hypothetical protein